MTHSKLCVKHCCQFGMQCGKPAYRNCDKSSFATALLYQYDHFITLRMKPRFCAICRRHDDQNIARCLVCGQSFCNNATDTEASHILEHVRERKHVAFDFQELGVPFCFVCGKKNICQLFQNAEGALFCSKHNTGHAEAIVQDEKVVLRAFQQARQAAEGATQRQEDVQQEQAAGKTKQSEVSQQQFYFTEPQEKALAPQVKSQPAQYIENPNAIAARFPPLPVTSTAALQNRAPLTFHRPTDVSIESMPQRGAFIGGASHQPSYKDVMSTALLAEFAARGKQQQKFQKALPNNIVWFNVINGARFRVRLNRKTLEQMGIALELSTPVSIIASYATKTSCLNGTVAAIFNEDIAIDLIAPVGKCFVGPVVRFTDTNTKVIKQFNPADGVALGYQQPGLAVCLSHKGASYALMWTVKNAQLDAQLKAIQLIAENTANLRTYALIQGWTVAQTLPNDIWALSYKKPDLNVDIMKEVSIILTQRQNNSGQAASFILNDGQFSVISYALQHGFTLISGCPGSGKSYMASLIAFAFSRQHCGKHILCCAGSEASAQNLAAKIETLGIAAVKLDAGSYNNQASLNSNTTDSSCSLHSIIRRRLESRQYVGVLLDETTNNQLLLYVQQRERKVQDFVITLYAQLEQQELWNCKIVITTCLNTLDKRLEQIEFAAVVIDDANAIIEPECLLPIIKAPDHVVLIGDERQLFPPVVSQEARNMGLGRSLFSRLQAAGHQVLKLNQQYRMQSGLMKFCNDKFYAGGIASMLDNYGALKRRQGYSSPLYGLLNAAFPSFFWHVKAQEPLANNERRQVNYQEAEIVAAVVEALLRYYDLSVAQIGIITPYQLQQDAIKQLFSSASQENQRQAQQQSFDYQEFWALPALQSKLEGKEAPDLQLQQTRLDAMQSDSRVSEVYAGPSVMTLEEAQGCEKEVIVLSCVNSNEKNSQGIAKSWQKLNAALTRQRCALIIVGDAEYFLLRDSTQSQLVQYYAARQAIFAGQSLAMLHQLSLKAIQKAVTASSATVGLQQADNEKAASNYQAQRHATSFADGRKPTPGKEHHRIEIDWQPKEADEKAPEKASELPKPSDQPSKAIDVFVDTLAKEMQDYDWPNFSSTDQDDSQSASDALGEEDENCEDGGTSDTGSSPERTND